MKKKTDELIINMGLKVFTFAKKYMIEQNVKSAFMITLDKMLLDKRNQFSEQDIIFFEKTFKKTEELQILYEEMWEKIEEIFNVDFYLKIE